MPSFRIDAAFCSTTKDECYLFMKDMFVVVNYATKSDIDGPTKIVHRFQLFSNTIFENGIDCAFDNKKNETFVLKGNQCAKTTPPQSRYAKLLVAPIPITSMFPGLLRTPFENGIDASVRSRSSERVFLFKGNRVAVLGYNDSTFLGWSLIYEFFPSLTGTVFELGIDAAFNTHNDDEVYIFRGKYYAQYNIYGNHFLNGLIKLIDNDWPALRDMRID